MMTSQRVIQTLRIMAVLTLLLAPALPAHADTIYTVQPGDTLYRISIKFGVSVQAIRQANRLSGNLIYAGQRLVIPGVNGSPAATASPAAPAGSPTTGQTYTVQRGDTLWSIARRFGTTVATIKTANRLTSNIIYVGQKLTIPGQTPPATASPAPVTATPVLVTAAAPVPSFNVVAEIVTGIGSPVWSPDGKWLAFFRQAVIDLYETPSFKIRHSLASPGAPLEGPPIAFSPDGRWLAAVSKDYAIQLWDLNSGAWRYQLTGHTDRITSLRFSADSSTLVSAAFIGPRLSGPTWPAEIRVWAMADGKQLAARELKQTSGVGLHAAYADQTLLVTHTYGDSCGRGFRGAVEMWSMKTLLSSEAVLAPLWRKETRGTAGAIPGPAGKVAAYVPDVSCSTVSGAIVAWDAAGRELFNVLVEWEDLIGYSPSTATLTTYYHDPNFETREVRFRSAQTGQLTGTLNTGALALEAISSGLRWLAASQRRPDIATMILDVNTGKRLGTFSSEVTGSHSFGTAAFSPDGGWLLTLLTPDLDAPLEVTMRVRALK